MPTKQPTTEYTPFAAYAEKRKVDAKIAELQKQSKRLKSIIESGFRTNQLRLVCPDDDSLILTRELKVVPPFENSGYSYYLYSLQQQG